MESRMSIWQISERLFIVEKVGTCHKIYVSLRLNRFCFKQFLLGCIFNKVLQEIYVCLSNIIFVLLICLATLDLCLH